MFYDSKLPYKHPLHYAMLDMLTKQKYIVQPYYVGAREKRSVAIVIPAQLVKRYDFNPSTTAFYLKVNEHTAELYLKKIDTDKIDIEAANLKTNLPAGESLAATSQQVAAGAQ